jgi:comEA protein
MQNNINDSDNIISDNDDNKKQESFLDSIYKQGNGAFTNNSNLYNSNEFNLEEMTKVTQSDALNFTPKTKRRTLLSWKTLIPSALAICLVFGGLLFAITVRNPANTTQVGSVAISALPATSAAPEVIASPSPESAKSESTKEAETSADEKSKSSSKSSNSKNDSRININTADASALDTLSGIGPAIAQRIIDYRKESGPFQTIEDIKNVKGIGDSIFEKIKSQIRV